MAKKEPLYPHVPKSQMGKMTFDEWVAKHGIEDRFPEINQRVRERYDIISPAPESYWESIWDYERDQWAKTLEGTR